MPTGRVIIEAAFTELGVKPPDQDLGAADAAWGLLKLNRLLSRWATRRLFVFVINQVEYTFSTSAQTYTIGPTGNFVVSTGRPVRIERANLVLVSATPDVYIPLRILTEAEYAALGVPALSAQQPEALYYRPTVPNGTLYPWPYPTVTTNKLQLFTWNQLASFATLDTDVDLPQGYEDAITWSLAESMIPTYPSTASASEIRDEARRARADIQSQNSALPLLRTADSGMPRNGRRNDWSYLTGDYINR